MTQRQQGRHRDPAEGVHEAQPHDAHEGRHRAVAGQRAAVPPLLAASGVLTAAALTAIVLTGPQGADGGASADPPSADGPSIGSPGDAGGVPGADGIGPVVFSPGQGGMGNGWGGSAWNALLRQTGSAPAALAALCDAGEAGIPPSAIVTTSYSRGVGQPRSPSAPGQTSTGSSPGSMAEQPSPSARDGRAALGWGRAAGGRRGDPDPTTDGQPPVVVRPPGAPAPEPATRAVEPVVRAAEPVAEPVTRAAEPVTRPVAETVETVTQRPLP